MVGGELRKPDWWAQEQLDNLEAYKKIKEDLQKLREEVKAHFEIKNEAAQKDAWVADPKLNIGSVERVCEPAGVLDYSHMRELPMEYMSIMLTQEEITKCKSRCALLN